ncbi:DUF3999 domain-containing protein [Occallatibacter riparius]|uniref:DUF3999 domain-containing protein n=1 Tax=Occallatibacter riparius TaxID=1002689 RepID=A0A9J7BR33_9BACT|nr:DUF3999 domain-containing protein [Occallatibacter riparius]UWZ85332.1 DUF3999 domain-containing protein [Occallatibacter riparius]
MRTAAWLLLAAAAVPAADIHYFRYTRPVEATSANGQACVAIDPAVFAHAAPGLADLRLYNGASEVPYALRVASSPTVAAVDVAALNAGSSGGATVFDAAMPEGSYSDVSLSIKAQDFIASVAVSGSQAQGPGKLETKLGTFTIFDLTKQRLGRSTVLHLPQSDFRILHFRIDGPVKPGEIGGVTVGPARSGDPKYAVVAESAKVTRDGHASVIEFDVPDNTPVDRIVFVPGAHPANFSRDFAISVKPKKQPAAGEESGREVPLSGGNVERVHRADGGHRIDVENLTAVAPGWAPEGGAHWKVRLENGDDAPVDWRSVRLEMLERSLCFDAAPGAAYTLYYGDPALSAPQYDYARLFAAQPGAATAKLGGESANPGFKARPDARPFTERHPALLWIALGAVVLVLGGVALRSVKLTNPAE